jgi:hypothetical protein
MNLVVVLAVTRHQRVVWDTLHAVAAGRLVLIRFFYRLFGMDSHGGSERMDGGRDGKLAMILGGLIQQLGELPHLVRRRSEVR